MCLNVERYGINKYKRLALKNIVCYKHLLFSKTYNDYTTPYQMVKVEIGKTYESKLILNNGNFTLPSFEIGLHSFVNRDDAKLDSNNYYGVVVKCIIPRFSSYYVGYFRGSKCYASNKLKYIEICV